MVNKNLLKLAEKWKNPSLPAERETKKQPVSQLDFHSTQDFWSVPGVEYRNGIYRINLAKQLLNNGNAKTQEQWIEYYKQAKQRGEFYTGDMPLYHALFTALYKQKDNLQKKSEIEEAREFIQKQMRKKWLTTLTRIAYQPNGKDKVMHNYKTSEQYELEENIVGKDRFIESGDRNTLKALLLTDNIQEINSIYQWLNQTKTYLLRLNSKPENVVERVARFDASSVRTRLNGWDPENSDSSLGVQIVGVATQKIND